MLPIGILAFLLLLGGQQAPPQEKPEVVMPSGKSQKQEILKADFEKSKADAVELADLAQQLKQEIEKNDKYVVDMRTLKKAEEIEKLARRIKQRMRRYY